MKIGIDLHGVITKYPCQFASLSLILLNAGHEVHILTGRDKKSAEVMLKEFGIKYSYLFSIVDHHKEIGTEMWNDDSRGEGWWKICNRI